MCNTAWRPVSRGLTGIFAVLLAGWREVWRCERLRSLAVAVAGAAPWPLLAVLTVQAVLSLRLVWSNTAFTDEALYLWAGHQEWAHWLHRIQIPDFPVYFSGAPVIYPPIGAAVDSVGGLVAARLLSLAFMLAATLLLYLMTARFFGSRSAILASALFVVVGPTQDLGAFATYDAAAIFLLALSAWLATRAHGPAGELMLAASGLVMALADATKYASTLWDPVIIALATLTASRGGWLRHSARGLRLAAYAGVPLCIALFTWGGHPYIRGVLFTTLARAGANEPVFTILWTAATYIFGLVFLAFLGVAAAPHGWKSRLLCLTLFAAALLAPLNEARIHTFTSLYKHVVFGAWFAASVGGYALARGAEINTRKGWRIGFAVAVLLGVIGFRQASDMYGYWPSSARMISAMSRAVTVTNEPVLADERDVIYYYLHASPSLAARITNYYYLDGPQRDAVQAREIRQHFFVVVETEFTAAQLAAGTNPILNALRHTTGYYLTTQVMWTDAYTHGSFEIWRYTPPVHAHRHHRANHHRRLR